MGIYWPAFSAEQFEAAIADALRDKKLNVAVSLLRGMAVAHPARCEVLLNGVEAILDDLAKAES
jgi:hypothetical protein